MISLYELLLKECEVATPANTMGMGNPAAPTDTEPGTEPYVANKKKKKSSIKLRK